MVPHNSFDYKEGKKILSQEPFGIQNGILKSELGYFLKSCDE